MNTDDFFKLVAQMRQAQKDYFRTRRPDVLEESKRLEKAVDKALKEHNTGMTAGLFDTEI